MNHLVDLRRRLLEAAEHGNASVVEDLLDNRRLSPDSTDEEGCSALHYAAANGHDVVVISLLERRVHVNHVSRYGWTALMHASLYGHIHVVNLLLDHKADPCMVNKLGSTALVCATRYGHINVVHALVACPGSNTFINPSYTSIILPPIFVAIQQGHEAIAKFLIEKGASPNAKVSDTGWTPLMFAALSGNVNLIQLLLSHRADANVCNILDQTAYDIANQVGNSAAEAILEKYTDANLKLQRGKMLRLDIIEASKRGDFEQVKYLLSKSPQEVNRRDEEGATPLIFAAMRGHLAIAELLVEHGIAIDAQDEKSGWTALMQAIYYGHRSIARLLMDHDASVSLQALNGCTAFDIASLIGDTEVVQLLAAISMRAPMGRRNLTRQTSAVLPFDDEFESAQKPPTLKSLDAILDETMRSNASAPQDPNPLNTLKGTPRLGSGPLPPINQTNTAGHSNNSRNGPPFGSPLVGSKGDLMVAPTPPPLVRSPFGGGLLSTGPLPPGSPLHQGEGALPKSSAISVNIPPPGVPMDPTQTKRMNWWSKFAQRFYKLKKTPHFTILAPTHAKVMAYEDPLPEPTQLSSSSGGHPSLSLLDGGNNGLGNSNGDVSSTPSMRLNSPAVSSPQRPKKLTRPPWRSQGGLMETLASQNSGDMPPRRASSMGVGGAPFSKISADILAPIKPPFMPPPTFELAVDRPKRPMVNPFPDVAPTSIGSPKKGGSFVRPERTNSWVGKNSSLGESQPPSVGVDKSPSTPKRRFSLTKRSSKIHVASDDSGSLSDVSQESSEPEDLSGVLKKHALDDMLPLFLEQEVDLDTFLTLTEEDLSSQFGIEDAEKRDRIIKVIQKIHRGGAKSSLTSSSKKNNMANAISQFRSSRDASHLQPSPSSSTADQRLPRFQFKAPRKPSVTFHEVMPSLNSGGGRTLTRPSSASNKESDA